MKFLFLILLLSINCPSIYSQAFINYNRFNSPLPDNQCRAIAIDSLGRIWFGTEYGLAILDDTTWNVYTTVNSNISDNSIKHISFDENGLAWIATQSGGVCTFDGVTWNSFTPFNSGIASDYVRTIHFDTYGNKWITTNNGLNFYDDSLWTVYNISNSDIPVNHVTNMVIVNDSVRWVGTVNGGLLKMTNDSFYSHNVLNGFPDNTVLGMAKDSSGFLWLACPASGLVREYNSNFFLFNNSTSGIPSNSLTSVIVDSAQNLYIGSYDYGLIKKDGIYFTSWNTSNSPMPDDLVFCMAIERPGVIWLGTNSQGVVRFDENAWINIPEMENNITVSIYPIPCESILNISWKDPFVNMIIITDVTGKTISRDAINGNNNSLTKNVSSFSPGIYFVSISSPNNSTTRLFIKN